MNFMKKKKLNSRYESVNFFLVILVAKVIPRSTLASPKWIKQPRKFKMSNSKHSETNECVK
jgi:hypothetical protein